MQPSIEELDTLPHRAIVAFAVRNAMRVLPFYLTPRTHADPGFRDHAQSLVNCIWLAAEFCEGAQNQVSLGAAMERMRGAGQAAIAAIYEAYSSGLRAAGVSAIDQQVISVLAVIRTAASAASEHSDECDPAFEAIVTGVFTSAVMEVVAGNDAQAANDAVSSATVHDYEVLLMAVAEFDDRNAFIVDPSETGPLGPLWLGPPIERYTTALVAWHDALK